MLPEKLLNYDWYNPHVRFVRVARSKLDILGSFECKTRKLAQVAAEKSGRRLLDDQSSVLMPVHELQIPNIRNKFPDVKILHRDIRIRGLAQSSIRSLNVESDEFRNAN